MSNSNSHSTSSSSSSNQVPFSQEHNDEEHTHTTCEINDLTLYGSPAPTLIRSGTVRRMSAGATYNKKERQLSSEAPDVNNTRNIGSVASPLLSNGSTHHRNRRQEKFGNRMRSLDSTFRHSLESISENKTKRSFSPTNFSSNLTTNEFTSSLESVTSDQTDYAIRSVTTEASRRNKEQEEECTLPSPGSSYLTWMESVNSGYFSSSGAQPPRQTTPPAIINDMVDVDSKVGEWNNFWLNYNSARNKYKQASPYIRMEDNKADDGSDAKSTSSTQKELLDKNAPADYISMTSSEIHEALRCSQRLTEILQNALTRNDHDCANSNNESSYYSENHSYHNSYAKDESREAKEDMRRVARERSSSYIISTQELIRQKETLKPTTSQSSSTSCIKELLNTGVADILKRVINKRRDVITPDDHSSSMTRHSFSEWSSK